MMYRALSLSRVTAALVLACSLLLSPRAADAQTAPGAPTIGIATAGNGQASVAFTALVGPIDSYRVTATPGGATGTGATSPVMVPGLANGTVYRFTVTATSNGLTSLASGLSNPVIPATRTVPALDSSITWVLPSWNSLAGAANADLLAMVARLRSEIGEGPKAKIGVSMFVALDMPNWTVNTSNASAMEAALAAAIAPIDRAIAQAQNVKTQTSIDLPIGISLVTAIRSAVDGVETAASNEDWRNIQWYTDNSRATGWMTFSQYARKMRSIKEAYVRGFGRLLADRMALNPNILVAVTGDGEMEMTYDRFLSTTNPSNTATRSWADYSPFAQAEFRDWLTARGMYAAGQSLAGQSYRFAARYATDPTPGSKGSGVTGNTFNQDFGTSFTTWDLKFHNWLLTDSETAGAITGATGSATSCLNGATLINGFCVDAGGFDAPRPNAATILTNNEAFWLAFLQFRAQMINRYNRDFAKWITEATATTDPSLGGVPFDRWYSAQVPTDVLFGSPAPDGGVRGITSGSPHWTADISPYGGVGVTGYNVNGGGPGANGNTSNFYDRTVGTVVPLVAALSSRWAIVEWNPADPWSASMDSYRADNEVMRRYRPSLLMPFKVNDNICDTATTTCPEHQWAVFAPAKFAAGLRELMNGQAAVSATPSHPAIPARNGIKKGDDRGGWLSTITWATPAPIGAGSPLTSAHLSATANRPGAAMTYALASGTALTVGQVLPAGTHTLVATFTPTDTDYAIVTASVTLVVEAGASISGTVTKATGGLLAGATLRLYSPLTGLVTTTTTTDQNGVYRFDGLPQGSYVVAAFAVGFEFVFYDVYGDRACFLSGCNLQNSVTWISLTAGSSFQWNPSLKATGRVRGRVADASNNGVSGVQVILRTSDDLSAPPVTTASDGTYEVSNLAATTYYARTSNQLGYVDQAYEGLPTCNTCPASQTTGFAVGAGETKTGINFTLTFGARVSGTVRNASNTVVSGVTVGVFQNDLLKATAVTGTDGLYTTAGLRPGTYRVKPTVVPAGYYAPGGTGTEVTIAGTATTTANFTLSSGGQIRGTVADLASTGLVGIEVRVLNFANVVTSATTGPAGTYEVTGLAPGQYWVRTANRVGRLDRIYNGSVGGTDCLACGLASGTAITVTQDSVTNADFTLQAGGSIAGTLTGDSRPLVGAGVQIFKSNNELIEQVTTDASGRYQTTGGLPEGNYYIHTANGQDFNDEFYNDNGCVGCLPNTTSAVVVGSAQAVPGINFVLIKGGWVTGRVTANGSGVAGATVEIFTSVGVKVATGTTGASGAYRTSTIPAASYFALVRSPGGLLNQVFRVVTGVINGGLDCVDCNPLLGSAFGVSNNTEATGINFTLSTGGRISGSVQANGGALAGVDVVVFSEAGKEVSRGTSSALGFYTTQTGLPAGSYFAKTENSEGYVNLVYDNVVADARSVTSGIKIVVETGSTTNSINFTLTGGGSISGIVSDSGSRGVAGADVEVFGSKGQLVTTASTDEQGQYTARGLSPGSYRAKASSSVGHIARVFPNFECAGTCSPLIGEVIVVAAGAATTGKNFTLSLGGRVSGLVRSTTNVGLANVQVDILNRANRVVATTETDGSGKYLTEGLRTGSYYVRTSNRQKYVDQVYSGQACVGCTPSSTGTAVSVATSEVAGIDFSLARGDTISGTVTGASDDKPLAGIVVQVVNGLRGLVGTATTDIAGRYETRGLPAESYYVHSASTFGHINKVHINTECVACDPTNGTAVSPGATVNFSLAEGGSISGRVTDEASTPAALGGIQIRVYTSTLSYLTEATTDNSGNYTVRGLTPGRYYLHTANDRGYVDEALSGRLCFDDPCAEASLREISVTVASGATATGANFAIAIGARVTIAVENRVTSSMGVTNSDTSQTFKISFIGDIEKSVNVPPGTYLVLVSNNRGGRAVNFAVTTLTVTAGQEVVIVETVPVCTPPAFSTTSLSSGRAGTAYSQTVSASGGSGARTYSVFDGYLAPGLAINGTTGAITGTPTASGTSNFTLGATDTSGCIGTKDLAITIAAAPAVNGTASPTSLRFAALKNGAAGALTSLTAAQTVSVTFTGASPDWSVSSNQTWLALSALGGTGSGSFTASIANPSNVIGASTSLSATITIAGSGISNSPLTIPVTLTIDQTNGATATLPFGQVDTPTQNAAGVQGAIGVTGWVLDNVGVTGVKIYRNCLVFDNQASCQTLLGFNVVEVGDAAFLAGARPDVEAAFSTFPQNNRAGWGYLMLTSMLPHVTNQQQYGGQGALTLYAIATDVEGNRRLLGRSSDPASPQFATPTAITMANDSIAKPFGAIDTPAQGQTVSGLLNNFGWALTPDSNTTGGEGGDILIPTNGSTMTVFIDSLPVALVAYNQCRGNVGNPVPAGVFCNDDVSNIFGNATPQAVLTPRLANATLFRNLDAGRSAIGVYSFNTATLSNGLHTIAWSVTDSAGRTEGIGSRFFNVLNSGADPAIGAECAVPGAECAEVMARADVALRNRPAEIRGAAWLLNGLTPGVDGVWVRRGFDLSTPWTNLPLNDEGQRVVEIDEAGRLDLWLGAPIDAGYLVANGTLRDLPVGASVDGARVTWAPPAGYTGTYLLALVRGGERVEILVTIGSR